MVMRGENVEASQGDEDCKDLRELWMALVYKKASL
jgi:hypothetical protein